MYLQQGDVLLFPVSNLPKNTKPLPAGVLHRGLHHTHGVEGKHALDESDGITYLRAFEQCRLTHTEHGGFEVPPGIYIKDIVKEYDHWSEESRKVID